jgi:hypothetical protein
VTDDENLTSASAKARKAAYAETMKKLKNDVDMTKPWTFPPFTELDEYGRSVSGGDLPDGGAPSRNSRRVGRSPCSPGDAVALSV